MASWTEPKSDYKASDQVTPDIFNELAENEKYLKEFSLQASIRPITGPDEYFASLVLVEQA